MTCAGALIDSILDHAPCGYLVFDDEGELRAVNSTLAELLGYNPAELAGKKFESILSVGARIFYHTHLFPILKLHGRVEEIYLTMRTHAGTEFPVLTNAVRREFDGEKLSECIFVRMLQRGLYEDELLRAKQDAEAANEAKAKFLSMMSHEFRTPLQAIMGYCHLLRKGQSGPVNDEQKFALNSIESAGQDLARMLNDVLEFARLERQPPKFLFISAPVAAVVARAEPLVRPKIAEAGLDYECVGCEQTRWLRADVDRLQQVLLNLLTNATKFTPRGGKITVECGGDDRFTRIAVRDTGPGIPKESLDKIFEPFVQLDAQRQERSQRGVGLGLAISRDLVRAMGGTLTVESELGAGATFTVALPAAEAESAAAPSSAS